MKTTVQFNQLPEEFCGPSEKKLRELDGFMTLENDTVEFFIKKQGQYHKRIPNLDTAKGYEKLCFYSKTTKKNFVVKAHRLIALAFLPNPSHHRVINHKDRNKTNNAPSNLEWCTSSQNTIHAIQHEAFTQLLTKSQVTDIYRRIHENKENAWDLAAEYGVCDNVINDIRSQRTYSYFTSSIELTSENFVKRLTPTEIREIYHLSRNRFYTLRQVAELYGIHFTLVSKIKNGKRYADITQHAA